MKDIQKGFTLAEVLIALTIIGVVAVLVMPQLINQLQKEQTGPMLGKVVNQIELTCRNMLQSDFDETFDNGGQPAEALSSITTDKYKLNPSNLAREVDAEAKNGSYFFKKYQASYKIKMSSSKGIADITIDTNAAKGPNSSGKDQFQFYLRDDGRLIPSNTATQKVVADGFRIKD